MHKLISEIIELPDRVRKGDFVLNLSKGVNEPEKTLEQDVVTPQLVACFDDALGFIEPDVLSKDRDKYESAGDQKYVDKAHRRGKVGWNVGRHIEVAPHYRRPHMALVWTGRGRAVPKIVPRRGSVVHRELVEKVPSGFGAGAPSVPSERGEVHVG